MLTNLDRVRRNWERLARTDPLWAILSDPRRRDNRWDAGEFFASGVEEIGAAFAYLDRLGLRPRRGRALDFGCGVGRLTQALAAQMREAHGIDVSPSMLDLARRYNRHGGRCLYHRTDTGGLPFKDGAFDLIYSSITLQHIPAPLAERYVTDFLRVLAPGGILLFQEAAEPLPPPAGAPPWRRFTGALRRILPRRAVEALRRLRLTLRPPADFEMHGIPRRRVERLIGAAGGRLVDVVEDGAAGAGWTSYRYCVVRPGAGAGASSAPGGSSFR